MYTIQFFSLGGQFLKYTNISVLNTQSQGHSIGLICLWNKPNNFAANQQKNRIPQGTSIHLNKTKSITCVLHTGVHAAPLGTSLYSITQSVLNFFLLVDFMFVSFLTYLQISLLLWTVCPCSSLKPTLVMAMRRQYFDFIQLNHFFVHLPSILSQNSKLKF